MYSKEAITIINVQLVTFFNKFETPFFNKFGTKQECFIRVIT